MDIKFGIPEKDFKFIKLKDCILIFEGRIIVLIFQNYDFKEFRITYYTDFHIFRYEYDKFLKHHILIYNGRLGKFNIKKV